MSDAVEFDRTTKVPTSVWDYEAAVVPDEDFDRMERLLAAKTPEEIADEKGEIAETVRRQLARPEADAL